MRALPARTDAALEGHRLLLRMWLRQLALFCVIIEILVNHSVRALLVALSIGAAAGALRPLIRRCASAAIGLAVLVGAERHAASRTHPSAHI